MLQNLVGVSADRPRHVAIQNEIRKQQLKSNFSAKINKDESCSSKSLIYADAEGKFRLCKKEDEKNGIWISFMNFSFQKVCTIIFQTVEDNQIKTDYFHFIGNTSSITLFPNQKQIDKTNGTIFEKLGDIENFYNMNSTLKFKILLNRNKLSIVTQSLSPKLIVDAMIPPKSESNYVETLMLSKTDNIYNPLKSWRSILWGDFRLFPR
tara:strand:- start:1170 stop:1793 length:624 start_codon:yes stop_codon:yes gene_type:complete